MDYKIIISPNAQCDIEEITEFYFQIGLNILIQFKDRLDECYLNIRINPYYQRRYKNFHCIPLRHFPCILFYKIDEENQVIRIISCFHTSKNPNKYPT